LTRLAPIILAFSLFASLLWLISCGQVSENPDDPVVAQVGEEKLTASQLKAIVDARKAMVGPTSAKDVTPDLVMDEWINSTLIAQEGKKRGLDQDEEIQRLLDDYLKGLLVQKMWEVEIEEKVNSVTEEEIQAFYEAVKDSEYKSLYPKVRMSLLTVKGLAEALDLAKRARAGEDFSELVAKYSIRKDLGLDGDMGYHRQEELPEKLRVAFGMQVGEVSDPIKFEIGYSIIKVTGQVEAGEYIPLTDKEKAQLYDRALQEKRVQYANEFINELKKNTKVYKFLHKYQEAIESEQETE